MRDSHSYFPHYIVPHRDGSGEGEPWLGEGLFVGERALAVSWLALEAAAAVLAEKADWQ